MTAIDLITLVCCAGICWFAWNCWRDLDQIKREIERREQGRSIKRRVLAEVAKQRMVQP